MFIVDMPRVLHDIICRSIDGCDDMVVVGSVHGGDDTVGPELWDAAPAVVVIGAKHPETAESRCPRLLAERAATKLLAVADDGGETFLYELRPSRTPLGELSPSALLAAIRSAAAATT